jgi:dolichol kinase
MITKLELKRQASHILLGLLIVALLYFDIIGPLVLAVAACLAALFSYARKRGFTIAILEPLLKHLERESEKERMRAKGLIFYLLGATFAVLLFPKDIALASIMILAIGDSVSRLVGPYGYLKHPLNSERFMEGVIIGGTAAAVGAMLFVPFIHAVAASAVAMFLEGVDIEISDFKLDDNLTIPLVSGGVMLIVSNLHYFF